MAKLTLTTLVILFMIGSSYTTNTSNTGTLGDIKYSILDPEKFVEKNGDGWVLMMGQDISGSDLHSFTGMSKLPDVRGNFIRSMNLGRATNGDPDTFRLVGSYQADTFKAHSHDFKANFKGTTHNDKLLLGNVGGQGKGYGGGDNYHLGIAQSTILPSGEQETRPKNIALFTYIKINE